MLNTEDILEPDRPLIDAHHHLWDWPGHRYLAEDLLIDAREHNLRQSVFVECAAGYFDDGPEALRPVGETEFVAAQAAATAAAGGPVVGGAIVSFANLLLGEAVREVLDAHITAGQGHFRGIRHSGSWDACDEVDNSHSGAPRGVFMLDSFRSGFAQLQALGLHFEAWCYHPQLPELASLARAFPDTTIVLNHVGGPIGVGPYAGQRQAVFKHWQEAIRDLAACSNVVLKLGGLAMPVNGFGWHQRGEAPDSMELATAFTPYFDFCIEQFGVERCFFESNFPVDKVSCSYAVLWNAFKRVAEKYSAAQRDLLFHDTALDVYGLVAR